MIGQQQDVSLADSMLMIDCAGFKHLRDLPSTVGAEFRQHDVTASELGEHRQE
jgi:hypothetical protein